MKIAFLAMIALIAIDVSRAQAGDVFTCRKISSDTSRLDCYDKLFGKTASPASEINVTDMPMISWSDLQVDYKKMRGKSVTTSGKFLFMGDQGLLYDKNMGMTAFFVDVESLPRDQRSLLYDNCTMGCNLNVTGKVGDVMMQKGIKAANVSLDD